MTALLLMRMPRSSYAQWKTYPSNARTLSTPVMVVVCSVLVGTVYTAPGKAVPRTSPLSNVPLCIHTGGDPSSLCLQIRVNWSEHSPPWSSRETVKVAIYMYKRKIQCKAFTYVYTYKCFDLHVHRHERGLRHTKTTIGNAQLCMFHITEIRNIVVS